MNLNALLDVDVVSVEAEDQVSLLLELVAPERDAGSQRPPGTLQVVLDRSGSMGDGRLEAAKEALEALIARLDPADNFGLVVFDDQVQVAVPAGPLTDKDRVRALIRGIWPGGMTNLSGGYLRGIQEARRVAGANGNGGGSTLLLLSDGHANQGVTDHGELNTIAATAQGRDVSTSTIGVGLGYDEELMSTVALGGGGNTHFAEQGDEAGAAIAAEADDLLEQVVQAASLVIRPTGDVSGVRLYNDLPATAIEDGIMVELGDFYSGEQRRLLLEIDVPAMPELGLAQVCELELGYVDVATLATETVTIPSASTSSRATRPRAASPTRPFAARSPSRAPSAPSARRPRRCAAATPTRPRESGCRPPATWTSRARRAAGDARRDRGRGEHDARPRPARRVRRPQPPLEAERRGLAHEDAQAGPPANRSMIEADQGER